MATNFPTSLDSLTNPTATDTLDSPPHDTQHADANDAIEALQAKVGVDGSAVTTSLDYKVGNLESRPVETKTASYTLVATDVNKRIVMNSASATTITVNTGIFSAGDTVWIHNIGAGTTTVTAGTATVNTAGSLDVGQWEGGSLYFTSASSAIFFRGGGAVNYGTATGGTSSSITVGGDSYTLLTFTASGTLTVTKAGIFDLLVIGGGGGSGHRDTAGPGRLPGGGGAGGYSAQTVYLDANVSIVVGAGGAVSNNGVWGTGSNSYFKQLASTGGGGGGNIRAPGAGGPGASGGGGMYSTAGGAGDGITGNNGGTGSTTSGGGGGGAGGAGGNGSGGNGGAGGNGLDASAFRGETAGTTYYAGGGGGGGSSTGGSGGLGGGGNGAAPNSATGVAGTANTGGGGGGPNNTGGSGVVLVRFKN